MFMQEYDGVIALNHMALELYAQYIYFFDLLTPLAQYIPALLLLHIVPSILASSNLEGNCIPGVLFSSVSHLQRIYTSDMSNVSS